MLRLLITSTFYVPLLQLADLMRNDGTGIYIGNVVWMVACPERAGDDGELKFLYSKKQKIEEKNSTYKQLKNDESVTVLEELAKHVASKAKRGPKPQPRPSK